MTNEEYIEYAKQYKITNANEVNFVLRQLAFEQLDAEVEMYTVNGSSECNDDEELADVITPEIIEQILDEYERRMDDSWSYLSTRNMRNAIQSVTGLVC